MSVIAVGKYLAFVFGCMRSKEWVEYYRKYKSPGKDPLQNVFPLLRFILLQIPFIALPTVLIFILECFTYAGIVWLALHGFISTLQSVVFITIIMFMIFTPGHDAAHSSISSSSFINGLIGRIAFELLGPIAVFRGWRALHLRHHKFTNDPDKDPDRYACNGPMLLLPLRWFTTIPQYCVHWLILADEPGAHSIMDKIEVTLNLTINFSICAISYDLGYFYECYFYWMLPSFFCHAFLVLAFDFLPHFQHSVTPTENRFKTTSNIETYSFLEPLLTLILHYQNYHLIHHLYPQIPFYRYKAKWEDKKQELLKQEYPVLQLKLYNIKNN